MLEDNDTEQTIVLDIGSGFAKSGWSGEDEPRYSYRSLVGRPRFKQVATNVSQEKDFYVGSEALEKRSMLALKPFFEHGNVTNWDDLEKLLHNIFFCDLKAPPEEHSVYSTYHPLEPLANAEKYTQILFETFNVPAFYSRHASMLALTATGKTTGLVVDIGHGVTYTSAVYKNVKIPYHKNRLNFGGDDVTKYLQTTLTERGYYFETSEEYEVIREMKEKLSYVALDFDEEMSICRQSSQNEKSYELPDGQIVTLGDNRFRCTEILFQPHLVGREITGVHELAVNHINNCDIGTRPALLRDILLIGGCSRIPGFEQRFKKELGNYFFHDLKIDVTVGKENIAWFGASLSASMSTFNSFKITHDEYDESGPSIFHRKCEDQYH